MKDGLENIDEVFKQAFDGFEANVDPSVWNNVQNSINSGAGSTPQVDPSSVTGIAGKSLAVKIVAGAALLGTVATATYFVPSLFEEENPVVTENVMAEEQDLVDIIEEQGTVADDEVLSEETEKTLIISEETINVEEDNVVEQNHIVEEVSNQISEEDVVLETSNSSSDQASSSEESSTQKATAIQKDDPVRTAAKVVDLSVNISVNVAQGKVPLEVEFDAYGSADYFHWDFDDDSENESMASPIHTFEKEGTYSVKLIGQDEYGNSKTVYQRIIVEQNYTSSLDPIKKWFSPNGDGINDIIKFKGQNIDRIDVRVMDSKGSTVYSTKSIDDVWDGKDQNGNYLIQGIYFIVVAAIGEDGKDHVIQQSINLRN